MARSSICDVTARSGIICAGNWIVDIVHKIDQWPRESDLVRINQQERDIGGGAANVISVLAKLETGLPLWPIGAIGDDENGRYITGRCVDLGLAIHLFSTKKNVATAHTHVMSVAGQSRTFFYHGAANDVLSEEDFPPDAMEATNARVFYLGYLNLLAALDKVDDSGSSSAATILGRAQNAGMVTCVDLVSVDRPDFAECLKPALPCIDHLILNEVELARASGNKPATQGAEPCEDDLVGMAGDLIEAGVRKAVVVHCPQKAIWIGSDGQVHSVPANPLPRDEVVSHLGAGDAFCAGILYAIHEGWEPRKALELGHAIARASLRGVTATEAIPRLDVITSSVLQSGTSQNGSGCNVPATNQYSEEERQ